ncbi:MAG: multicopper oxidase domain-containing protein [candidate division KSB1 bacterium]|nr:multicopper oxidase domain-containing protein [candidate division KSB1 bacterium]
MKRRTFFKTAGLGALAANGLLSSCGRGNTSRAAKPDPDFIPDIEINLTAKPGRLQILDGPETGIWHYTGEVIKGDANALTNLPDTWVGPVIKARRGQKMRIYFRNQVDQVSIIHWHGLHVPPEADGHPRYVIKPGGEYVYEFTIMDRPGTYWFHPHPHGKTGPQVYRGLAGLFLVTDEEEEQLNLPAGDHDVPLIIQDRQFSPDNQLIYIQNRMQQMLGFLGDTVLVNGKSGYTLKADTGVYRLRILNGSNSRIYKLAWQDGTPMTVIGTDGGLLKEPVTRPFLTLGPAERFDVIADFSDRHPGDELKLVSLPIPGVDAGMGMMGRGMMGGTNRNVPENGAAFDISRVKITHKANNRFQLPSKLSDFEPLSAQDATNSNEPRRFEFAMGRHMQWTINGRTFEMTDVADYEKVKLNTTEIWEFINAGGDMGMMGGMMNMPHPVHIHGLQFKIFDRQIDPRFAAAWDALKDGVVDHGRKDSFLLLPGARVQVALRFEDFSGLYLYHCHNLEHEDMGMMRNYRIESG